MSASKQSVIIVLLLIHKIAFEPVLADLFLIIFVKKV